MCYCEVCHEERGDDKFYTRGQPPQKYALPIGWYRFGLAPYPQAQPNFKTWYRAYHGTKLESIKKILEVGHLCMPGDILADGFKLRELDGHFCETYGPKGFDSKRIFVSPSIIYSGDYYSPAIL